jgi:hypothetical protein
MYEVIFLLAFLLSRILTLILYPQSILTISMLSAVTSPLVYFILTTSIPVHMKHRYGNNSTGL